LEFLKFVLYPFALLFMIIVVNHMGTIATLGLLMIFLITCFTDTFAYMVGMVMRGPALLPKKFQYISPKKTIAGFVGGLFGGMVGALVCIIIMVRDGGELQALLTESIGYDASVKWAFMGIGLLGAVVTTAGDLYASWLKRKTDIKDFGKYLPGHGGAMDRLDSISFNSMFICLMLWLVVFV